MYLFYDNNGSPFSKPVISLDSVCEVLKGGAVFYRHDLGRERYGKGAFTRRMLDGDRDRYESARPARGFAYEERCMWIVGKECRRGIVKRLRVSRTSSTWGSPWFRLKRDSLAAVVSYSRTVDKEHQRRVRPYKANEFVLIFHVTRITFHLRPTLLLK